MSLRALPAFQNEPYTDFTVPDRRQAAEQALARVRQQLGRHYDLLIAGQTHTSSDTLVSVNPARPSEVVGKHAKATPDMARQAVEQAFAYFPTWSSTPVE